jgi:D-sedoheptulose 7-phosphate isomerase
MDGLCGPGGFAQEYLTEAVRIIQQLDTDAIERAVALLAETRERGGRLFVLGVGGGAANASHAVNDFRKLAGFEAYAPTDNVSELTARINDDGWPAAFEGWLRVSRVTADDLLLVFSVGGGDLDRGVSPNLVHALRYGRERGARILGVVGRAAGYTAQVADVCIVVPPVNPARITPHTESMQAVLWHLMVTHPRLTTTLARWESLQ